jgi:hypothetical protein
VHEDNTAAIAHAKNNGRHDASKHFRVRLHYVREVVEQGLVTPVYTPTAEMVADLLTKPLPRERFQRLCEVLVSA